jgi:hypothetical protein
MSNFFVQHIVKVEALPAATRVNLEPVLREADDSGESSKETIRIDKLRTAGRRKSAWK